MLLNQAIFAVALGFWIALIGAILVIFIRTGQAEGFDVALRRIFTERLVIVLLVAATIVTLITNSIVFIQPQEVGVVRSLLAPRGYREEPLQSGLHLVVPISDQVQHYPTYLQTFTISTVSDGAPIANNGYIAARTSDGQVVYIEVSLIYAIDPAQVIRIFLDWQDRYQTDLISPMVRGLVRSKVSQFSVDQVNSDERLVIEGEISEALHSELGGYGFNVRRFILRNISFSPEYAQAVEEKQVALQQVTRDQYRAQQIQIISEAQSAALLRLGAALAKNPDVATLSYIEKLAPSITTLLVPNNVPFILPLPTAFSRADAAPKETVTPTPTGQATPTQTSTSLFPTVPAVGTPVPVFTPQPVPSVAP